MRYYIWVFIFCLVSVLTAAEADGVVEWIKRPDLVTNHMVWQITSHDSSSETVYYENQAFTDDDKYIVFCSNRSGDLQIYRADLHTGKILPISDKRNPGRFTIGPNGQHAWYMHDKKLYKTNVETCKESMVIDFNNQFPNERIVFSRSFTNDGVYTLIWIQEESQQSIYRVNLDTKKVIKVLSREKFGHPQICPVNPDLITHAQRPDTQNDMSLPMDKRTHTWIFNMSTGEYKRFLTVPYGFRVTHPTWSFDGKRFFFFQKKVPGWKPVSICSMDTKNFNFQQYYSHYNIKLGHGVSSADGKWFVTDGQDPHYNPIILINLETGKATTLCWPNSSIYNQHVHPSISKSGRYICYTSDLSGNPQVYVVPTGIDHALFKP